MLELRRVKTTSLVRYVRVPTYVDSVFMVTRATLQYATAGSYAKFSPGLCYLLGCLPTDTGVDQVVLLLASYPLTQPFSSLPQVIPTANAVSLEDDGDYARFENRGKEALDFMLIEAEPTRESVVARVRR